MFGKSKKQQASIKNEIDIVGIGDGSIIKSDGTRFLFFKIEPSNLAVLSDLSVRAKIMDLMSIMQITGQIEMYAMDAKENYTGNKNYVTNRIKEETNPKLKDLLRKELRYVKEIESETSTSRQFLIVLKVRKGNERETKAELDKFMQVASQTMLRITKCTKDDVKSILAIYFHNDPSDQLPDFDGQLAYDDVDFDELREKMNSGEFEEPIVSFHLGNKR